MKSGQQIEFQKIEGRNQQGNEEEDSTLLTEETTIALHVTKRREGSVLNHIDSYYSRRGRQKEKRHT